MQLFWLLLVMGSYKILQLFSSLLFASTMLKISQSMGSVKYHKAFVYPREYPPSPECVNQPKGTSPCLLNAQREQISLSHGFYKSTKSSS